MKRLIVSLGLALVLVLTLAGYAFATNPIVTITVSAKTIAITNTHAVWVIGPIEINDTIYFSADGTEDDTYSQITNTGNVTVDIEIQGTDAEGGAFDWTLDDTAGDKIYSLYANSEANPDDYSKVGDGIEVTSGPAGSGAYNDLIAGLVKTDTYDWSMLFTAPTAFDAGDLGADKTAVVTLAVTESP